MDEAEIKEYIRKQSNFEKYVAFVELVLIKDYLRYYVRAYSIPLYLGIPIFYEVDGDSIREVYGRGSLLLMDEMRDSDEGDSSLD